MKRTILYLVTMLTAVMTSQAMTYTQAQREALFLTDKMAYELGLTESQYDAVYEINFDYLVSLSTQADLYDTGWYRRNLDLGYVLTAAQYGRYCTIEYFYRPVYWSSGFRYRIYSRYADRSRLYYGRPKVYATYRGGHSWRSNGGKSWYKGRTYSSGGKMKVVNRVNVSTGSRNHSKKTSHAVKDTPAKKSGHAVKPSTAKRTTKANKHNGNFKGKR